MIDFAYSFVVAIDDIDKGQRFTTENVWVKRPGTGQIHAAELGSVLGKKAADSIKKNQQINWSMVES